MIAIVSALLLAGLAEADAAATYPVYCSASKPGERGSFILEFRQSSMEKSFRVISADGYDLPAGLILKVKAQRIQSIAEPGWGWVAIDSDYAHVGEASYAIYSLWKYPIEGSETAKQHGKSSPIINGAWLVGVNGERIEFPDFSCSTKKSLAEAV